MSNIYAVELTELEQSQFRDREVLFEILKKSPGAYVAAVKRLRDREEYKNWKQECIDLMRAGKKVDAVKACRNATGMGLKDALDAVEALPQQCLTPNSMVKKVYLIHSG